MATTQKGMYHSYAHARGVTVGSFKIEADSPPVISDDPGGIVASVVDTMNVGEYVVTLKRQYSRIHAVAQNDDTAPAGLASHVSATVAGGTVSNTITIQILDAAGAGNAGTGSLTTVAFYGYDS